MMNANTALDGHTTVIKMAERGGVPLSNSPGRHYAGAEKSPAQPSFKNFYSLVPAPTRLDSCLFPFISALNGRSMGSPHKLILPEAHTNKYTTHFSTGHHWFGTVSQQLFRTSHVIRRLRKKLKKNGQHTCTQRNSITL